MSYKKKTVSQHSQQKRKRAYLYKKTILVNKQPQTVRANGVFIAYFQSKFSNTANKQIFVYFAVSMIRHIIKHVPKFLRINLDLYLSFLSERE